MVLSTPSHLLHRPIVVAMSDLRTAEHTLAGLLAEMARLQGWRALGYSSLGDYAVGALQLEPKKARDLARLGARLADFPRLDAAMQEGTLPWTKARELVRVVAPDTEEAWIAKAQEISSAGPGRAHRDPGPAHPGR